MKAHRRRLKASIFERYRYNLALSVMVGLLTMMACVSLCALVVSLIDVPLKVLYVLNGINLGVGGYVSGYVSAIRRQKRGILSGTLCGLMVSLTVVIVGSIFNVGSEPIAKVCKVVIGVVCGALGGIQSANSHSI